MGANFEENQLNVTEILQEMGLTESEANVYRLLIQEGGATGRDILRRLNLRQPQLYDITSGLERKGFINVIEGRPKRYEAIEPEVIYQMREITLKQNKETFLNWAGENRNVSYEEKPEIWMARNGISFRENSLSVISSAKNFILIHTTYPDLKNYIDALKIQHEKGVRIFLLLFDSNMAIEDYRALPDLEIFSNVRKVDIGKFFVVIADETISAFMPRNVLLRESREKYGYIFRDRDMTWFLTHNFFAGWFIGTTVSEKIPPLPARYSNQRIAMADLQTIRDSGVKEISLAVSGHKRIGNKEVRLNGVLDEITITAEVLNFSLSTPDGNIYSIGGYDSKIEDIISSEVVIHEAK